MGLPLVTSLTDLSTIPEAQVMAAVSPLRCGRPCGIIHAVKHSPAHDSPTTIQRLAQTRAVLFDLDGTLLDTIALILSSFRHATTTVLGDPLPDEVLLRNVGIPLAVQMVEFDADRAEELLAVYRVHSGEHHDQLVKAYPGVAEVVAEMEASGMPMAVVTSKSRAQAERGLTITGLRDRFPVLVACEDTDEHKPNPAPLRLAARHLGVDLRYCVYVGDSPHDVRAACDGGAIAIGATWGVSSAEEITAAGPDFVIGSIDELPGLLDEACARTHSDVE
jgi:pyrophosphatase PpaX